MRQSIPALIACTLLARPAIGDEGYKFHLRVTDARTALLVNPKFSDLKMPAEQLDRAAKDRVLLLDHGAGGHWTWLMLSWPENKPAVEQGINARGSAAPGHGADIGLTPQNDGTIRARCYRETCHIRAVTPDRKETTAILKNGESKEVPIESDFDLSFADR